MKILHLDDNDDDLILTRKHLLELNRNLTIESTASAADALEKLESEDFDCIVSDYRMSQTEGIEFLTEVRRRGIDTPFIFFTGHSDEETTTHVLRAGANACFTKGHDRPRLESLLKGIAEAVESSRHRPPHLEGDSAEGMKATQEIEEKYNSLLQAMEQGVVYQDPDGRIISANPAAAQILGLAPDKLQGRKLDATDLELVEQDGSSVPASSWSPYIALNTGKTVRNRLVGLRASGMGTRWILMNSVPLLRGGEESPYQVFTILSDVTRSRQTEAELKSAQDELGRLSKHLESVNNELIHFSRSVAHDLRQPLRTISGYCNLLVSDFADVINSTGLDYLHKIYTAILKMDRLIGDLSLLAKVSSRRLKMRTINLSTIVRNIAESLHKQEPERKAEFAIQEGVFVKGDKTLIKLAVEHLMNNAWKFSREKPITTIEFGTDEKNGVKVLYIRDNGTGFDMRVADKIFDPFRRLHSSDENKGTGIGLATVQRIIHRHGGCIWAEADKGKGATFYFTLDFIS